MMFLCCETEILCAELWTSSRTKLMLLIYLAQLWADWSQWPPTYVTHAFCTKPVNHLTDCARFGKTMSECFFKTINSLWLSTSKWQCMKWPVAHSPNSTWFWLELVGNCCEWLKIKMKCTNIQFCERHGHGWQFHQVAYDNTDLGQHWLT